MSRHKIIIANWKMHKSAAEAKEFIESLKPAAAKTSCQVFIAPPFTALFAASEAAKGSPISIGAQNMSDYDHGAHTGEIAASMIKEAGAQFVILGHSERRHLYHESDELIHSKLKQAAKEGLVPVLCIGETLQERESGQTEAILERQMRSALTDLSADDLSNLIVAYEPVWAIGTGKTATPDVAEQAHQLCRDVLSEIFGSAFAENRPILYGGSVKPSNVKELLSEPNIDGALVGGASLDVKSFSQLLG